MEFIHPFTAVIAGPTGCGKTQFVSRIITEGLIQPQPERVVWSYGEWQSGYNQLFGVDFVEGLKIDFDSAKRNLLVIDDLMQEYNKTVSNLFTKGSHHKNLSVIYIIQNLFDKGKEHRTISLNAHYLVVFKNPRDSSQITHLAKQVFPGKTKVIQEAYNDATAAPYGYLLLDFKQNTSKNFRLRTNIFPGETQFVYVAK